MNLLRFGIYYIPDKGNLYTQGCKILGYDIRDQKNVETHNFIKGSWVKEASLFGFHVTITDVIDIEEKELEIVESMINEILSCFPKSNKYTLTLHKVGFWHQTSDQLAVQMKANRNIEILHDILVSRIQVMGKGSVYLDRYKSDEKNYFPNDKEKVNKTKLFCAPYIFDDFKPHFTCINPFTGDQRERQLLEQNIQKIFLPYEKIDVNKLTLVIKQPDKNFYKIYREFYIN